MKTGRKGQSLVAPEEAGEHCSATTQPTLWQASVAEIRASPDLRANLLESVRSSMAFEGFEVDRARADEMFDEVLDGPPLVYPGEG